MLEAPGGSGLRSCSPPTCYLPCMVTSSTPKGCKIMAFWAIFRGFGPLFYLLWGFRFMVSCMKRPYMAGIKRQAWSPIMSWSPRVGLRIPIVLPKGPCTQELGTWDFGNSNYRTDFG